MKNLISIIVILFAAVGCGKTEEPWTPEGWNGSSLESDIEKLQAEQRKLTAEEEKFVGSYEMVNVSNLTIQGNREKTFMFKLLDNGMFEAYTNGKKAASGKWYISNGEVHTVSAGKHHAAGAEIYRINPEGFGLKAGSLTGIAQSNLNTNERTDFPENMRHTFKKLKE